jgi:hypothetical protein
MGLLDRTRQQLGPAPRVIGNQRVRFPPPSWMSYSDALYRTYVDTDTLLCHGDVVWGRIVQANQLLFSAGPDDCPAAVLFAEDRSFDTSPQRLGRAADEVYDLKEAEAHDDAYRRIKEHLIDERERVWRMPIPAGIARGKPLALATVMIHRAALPLPYLATTYLPLVVAAEVPTVIVLPKALWAADLVQAWLDLAAVSD